MHNNDNIQEDIESLRELILELDESIWLRINHKNATSLAKFIEQKRVINERIKLFQDAARELLQVFASTEPVNEPEVAQEKEEPRGAETISPITRPFVSVKPKGMIFEHDRIGPLKSWRAVWNRFLQEFLRRHPEEFERILVKESCIAGNADKPDDLIHSFECGGRFFECTLSANDIAKRIKKILQHAGLETSSIKIVLRGNPDLDGTIFAP